MPINRYFKQPLPFVAVFTDNPLTVYGYGYSDIENISMNLKKDLAKDSDDKYLEKKFNDTDGGATTGDVLLDETNHRFTMKPGDYGNALEGKYHLVIAIKISGLTEMIELQMKDDIINIYPDKNRA